MSFITKILAWIVAKLKALFAKAPVNVAPVAVAPTPAVIATPKS
jgi:hypothetical protein